MRGEDLYGVLAESPQRYGAALPSPEMTLPRQRNTVERVLNLARERTSDLIALTMPSGSTMESVGPIRLPSDYGPSFVRK